MSDKENRKARWYFGGIAGALSASCTHPLDLLKVHLQTQRGGEKVTIVQLTNNIIKKDGIRGMYSGISAAICRQLTYSTARFGIYEMARQKVKSDTFYTKVALAGVAGACGGLVGTPADMINVRMQNDIKLPPEQRRNYKHAIDGMIRVVNEEGFSHLFAGAAPCSGKATLMTIGQLSFYDQVKQMMLASGVFGDNIGTHFISSAVAGAMSTLITQPIDVLKTRMMNAKPGEYKSMYDCLIVTSRGGPLAFYKGFVPASIRLMPTTILVFLFYEQLRLNFGYIPETKEK